MAGAGRALRAGPQPAARAARRSPTRASSASRPRVSSAGRFFYLERERAHPYRPFLHYNSWYDLGYFNQFDEAGALDRVNAFGTELNKKRGVQLSSYLFDDGWDNPSTLWKFNSGFSDGFAAVRRAAEQYGAEPGVWMSPWGGYGKPRDERLAAGRTAGYEIVADGFALSGPKYTPCFAKRRST